MPLKPLKQGGRNVKIKYKPIKGFVGYRVGSDGSVWYSRKAKRRWCGNKEKWVRVKGRYNRFGYHQIRLYPGPVFKLVHVLVLEAFVGPRPIMMDSRHFPDQNPANNRLENLSWATRKQNFHDKIANGTTNRGERSSSAKLTEKDVRDIRQRIAAGETYKAVADDMGICAAQAWRIVKRMRWTHIK